MTGFEELIVRSNEVKRAMSISLSIVALKSTVLTHGLPRPQNLQLAYDMEHAIREEGATPATIAFLDGYLHIGLSESEIERLANEQKVIQGRSAGFCNRHLAGSLWRHDRCRDDVRLQTRERQYQSLCHGRDRRRASRIGV